MAGFLGSGADCQPSGFKGAPSHLLKLMAGFLGSGADCQPSGFKGAPSHLLKLMAGFLGSGADCQPSGFKGAPCITSSSSSLLFFSPSTPTSFILSFNTL